MNKLLVILCIFILAGCSSPYIGRTVNLSAPSVCIVNSFPATCSLTTNDFAIDYKITEIGDNQYEVEGIAKKISGTSGTFTDYSRATFTLILINNGVVVETVMVAGGSGSFDRGITFNREFSPENTFDAIIVTYDMQAMG